MKQCPKCGSKFDCGNESKSPCWCNSMPPIFPMDEATHCFCAECLKQVMIERIEEYVIQVKGGSRDNIAASLPKQELLEGIDYYMEGHLLVFSEWYHLKRGYCCQNGCRHCPYPLK